MLPAHAGTSPGNKTTAPHGPPSQASFTPSSLTGHEGLVKAPAEEIFQLAPPGNAAGSWMSVIWAAPAHRSPPKLSPGSVIEAGDLLRAYLKQREVSEF